MKYCTKCNVERSFNMFRRHINTKDRLNTHCKSCERDTLKKWRLNNPEKKRMQEWRHNLNYGYNITPDIYLELLNKQGNTCAICFKICCTGRSLAVDHCHRTGTVRGLLCSKCNMGIGLFNDNPDVLISAIKYIMDRRNL